jgi:peptidoglycan/LPS O-acetylase OafA/YrhL
MKVNSARFDIEALRAFAVTIVILFHAGLLSIPGGFIGVDVFFVISGYLIIGALYREYLTEGRILILDFWGRRARRLLPAASLVLIFSGIAAYLFSGRFTLRDIQYDIAAAATYLANFRFAASGSDYWAPEYISPVLHYWSLSVEEQFYIFIPIAVLLAHVILWKVPVKYIGRGFQGLIWITLFASFAYGVQLVASNPISGYYNSVGRAWEFAVGGLVAITAIKIKLTGTSKLVVLGGLWAALIASAFVINETLTYPGISTVVPVVITALIMWMGDGSKNIAGVRLETGNVRKLKLAVAQIGTHSYSLYLWHWPVLWLIAELAGGEDKNPAALSEVLAVLGIAITAGLSVLTKKYVEDPIRFNRNLVASSIESLRTGFRWSFTTVAIVGIVSLMPASGLAPPPSANPDASATASEPEVQPDSAQDWFSKLIVENAPPFTTVNKLRKASPELIDLRNDLPSSRIDGCHAELVTPEPSKRCSYGLIGSEKLIYLIGDSHAQHYMDGMAAAAENAGFELRVRTRSACPVAKATIWDPNSNQPYELCDTFREDVLAEAVAAKPDLVIFSSLLRNTLLDPLTGSKVILKTRAEALWAQGYKKAILQMTNAGIKVVVLRDTPQWGFEIADCLATFEPKECSIIRGSGLDSVERDSGIANKVDGALGLDPLDMQCGLEKCYAIRDNIIMMRDASHFSRTYSTALEPVWEVFFSQIFVKWDELQTRKQ